MAIHQKYDHHRPSPSPHSASPFHSPRLFLISIAATIPLLILPRICVANSDAADYEPFVLNVASKRGGARAFNFFAPDEKRGGARAFNFFASDALPEKRSGGRAFGGGIHTISDPYDGKLAEELKRAGARMFRTSDPSDGDTFVPKGKKRGGARPFFGGGGYMDGAWKRAGGRYFLRHFDGGGGGGPFAGGWMAKRGGGRSFFGSADGLFNSGNYWAPQHFVLPIDKHSRQPLLVGPLDNIEGEEDADELQRIGGSPPSPFFTNNHNFDGRANGRKRGGARAFVGTAMEEALANGAATLEKRGGGRNFNEMGETDK